MRRFIAFWLAVSIGFFTVVTPARAFAPVAVLAAPVFVGGGGTSWGMGAIMGAIGAVIGYMEITDALGNSSRIALSENPVAPIPEPVAPPTAQTVLRYYATGGGDYAASPSAACQGYLNLIANACYSHAIVSVPAGVGSCLYDSTYRAGVGCNGAPDGTVFHQSVGIASSPGGCPSGYILTGGNCVLQNARKAVPDANCDLLPVNGKFEYNDADCPDGVTFDHSKGLPGIRREGEVAWMYGTNSYGDPVLAKVIINPDGTREVMYAKRILANIETTKIKTSAGGEIQSVSVDLAPGQITAPVQSASTAPGEGTALDTPQVTTDPTKAPITQFPDDYARESTMQRTATGVENLLKPTETADPTIPGSTLFDDSFFKTTFGALKGWQLPSHSSQCPTGSIDLFGAPRIINAHCTLLNDQAAQLQAAMMVVWTLLGLFIVLRA